MGTGLRTLPHRRPGRAVGPGRRRWVIILGVSAVPAGMLPTGSAPVVGAATSSTTPGDTAWTRYHHDPAGSGVAAAVASVDTATPAWTSPSLDGQVYGEPLVSGGQVYVATENDTVYALSSSTGAVVWSTHVGNPVPSGSLPCGDISPVVGITGTPVVDPARSEIFVVADTATNGQPAHLLVGLNTATGRTLLSQNVDPSGSTPPALLQRTGLTLDANQVVFGFGGNYADCSTYRGWLVGVNEAGGTPSDFAVDSGPGESQGAIWMGGAAPAVDRGGNLWVGVGNGSVTSSGHPYDNSDSVLELSSSLQLLQYFAPTTWASDNAHDFDLSMAPALLADGQVVASGKSGHAYLLNASHLGGIGGQEAALASVCRDDVDGGTAVIGTTVFIPCLSGTVALDVSASPARLQVLWTSQAGGGPPIIAAGLVWTIGQDGILSGLNPATGAVEQQAAIGNPVNHFPTPSVGDGVLLAAAGTRVIAFTAAPATGSPASAPVNPPATGPNPGSPPAPGVTRPGGGIPTFGIVAVVVGGVMAAGVAAWLLRRRRSHRPS